MSTQNAFPNIVPTAHVQNVAPPPLPMDNQPPPPPPPQQQQQHHQQLHQQHQHQLQQQTQQNTQNINTQVAPNMQHTLNCSSELLAKEQQSINHNKMNTTMITNQTQQSTSAQVYGKNANFEHPNYSQKNQEGFRKQQQFRNNRWNNNRNTHMFGHNSNNRNTMDRNEQVNIDAPQQNEYVKEEKSPEEIAFEKQFRKWEDSFMEWKRNNENHPDQSQYNDFVIKMEACRKQLLQRRETLRQKHLDSIREEQLQQDNQSLKTENKNESFVGEQSQEDITSTEKTENRRQSGSGLFTTDNDSGIPGLDLVNEEKSPKQDINISAHVNNILGHPEIQSFLSNIQRQQNETEPSKSQDIIITNTDSPQIGQNISNRIDNVIDNNEIPQRNPFGHNDRDDTDVSQFHADQEKCGRHFNPPENTPNDPSRFDPYTRNRNDSAQQVYSLVSIFYEFQTLSSLN